jgi:di/tripeptidase
MITFSDKKEREIIHKELVFGVNTGEEVKIITAAAQ